MEYHNASQPTTIRKIKFLRGTVPFLSFQTMNYIFVRVIVKRGGKKESEILRGKFENFPTKVNLDISSRGSFWFREEKN